MLFSTIRIFILHNTFLFKKVFNTILFLHITSLTAGGIKIYIITYVINFF